MTFSTMNGFFDRNRAQAPDKIWLKDRKGEEFTSWTWEQAGTEIDAVAAWLEEHFDPQTKIALLSRNRAHWAMADWATISSGNVVIPLFTTLQPDIAQYILEFAEAKVIILGESENWENVQPILPAGTTIITLPGITVEGAIRWDDIVAEKVGRKSTHKPEPDTMISLVFTSGTTGMPKGVIQTHNSFVSPIMRFDQAFTMRENARFLSYLPLSHIAERQLVGASSVVFNSEVTFAESMATLPRDMKETRPNFFFGPPRVWEQLQQMVLAVFGGQETLDAALAEDEGAIGRKVQELLGFQESDYLLTAAAPTPPALIKWFGRFGVIVMEGFGQTEAMGLIANSHNDRKIGSLGKVLKGVEARITEEGELVIKSDGLSPGYYNMPEKTAETFVDGWIHTGDKARIDEDGFVFLTGRVKDYFKTIQGKFVAPVPMEADFAENPWSEQQCLLGRGYSKTVMTCVLVASAGDVDRSRIETDLRAVVDRINAEVDKHARIGAIIISTDPWTIENGILTPTLKIKRESVEARFGERAQELALESATSGQLMVEWH